MSVVARHSIIYEAQVRSVFCRAKVIDPGSSLLLDVSSRLVCFCKTKPFEDLTVVGHTVAFNE